MQKRLLHNKATRLKASFNKQAAAELRQTGKEANLEPRIIEGHDED